MILGFNFHPEAGAEFVADVVWYDDREVAVGERFEIAVPAAIDAAVDSPESWAVWPGCNPEPVVRSKLSATSRTGWSTSSAMNC
ncbi:MAG: hypothetical protein WAV00_21875 [Nocardioides sp.]